MMKCDKLIYEVKYHCSYNTFFDLTTALTIPF